MSDLVIGLLVGLFFGLVGFLAWQRMRGGSKVEESISRHLQEIIPQHMADAREQLVILAREKLGAEKQDIKTDLENKRQAIEKLVSDVQRDLRESDKTSQAILQQMKDHEKITKDLSLTTEGLRKVLTNNQLRGQFGEQVAEDLLKMAGFVKGVDFHFNKKQDKTNTRPDFTIYMPDKTKINVDVKFPYANLQKATETEDKSAKKELLRLFSIDVREKMRQITTRDYINPEDKTVDFVILFVPNEMIFSYIYEKMNSVWQEGMENKVIMAGPFSFTAILRMVRQAYDNFRYQENIHEIVSLVRQFGKQFDMFNAEFEKLGNKIEAVQEVYRSVESTRTRQLTRVVDKIRLESGDGLKKELTDATKSF